MITLWGNYMVNLELLDKIYRALWKRLWRLLFASNFKYFGRRVSLMFPMKIQGAKYISIEDNVLLNDHAWLLALPIDSHTPEMRIGEDTYVGHFAHFVAVRHVEIGRNVIIADKVYISDNSHGWEDISTPVLHQPVQYKADAIIGDDTWLGENVCIVGARVGKHCVIGANSVVLKDIPDYCVAGGIPAKIIKRFDFESHTWRRTDAHGEFIDIETAAAQQSRD